jgi:Domain of unknown function (DUF4124)
MWIMFSLLAKGCPLLRMALTSVSGARLTFLALLLLIHSGWARAEIYTWVDRDGQVHFTDNASLIPPEYRDRAQTRPSSPYLESPPPPAASKKSERHQRAKPLSPRHLSNGGQAQVVAVLDGDTIVIRGGEKVRYTGISTILHSGLSLDSLSAPPRIAWARDARHYLAHLPSRWEQRNWVCAMLDERGVWHTLRAFV